MAILKGANLALRFVLELCLLGALGWIGYQSGQTILVRVALVAALPALAAIVWGLFVAPRARFALPEWLWVGIQLLLFGLAVVGLAALGQRQWATIFAVVTAANLLLVVLWKQHGAMKVRPTSR